MPPPLPPSFTLKKTRILADLSHPPSEYVDKSPKGSVDAQIINLIAQINAVEGLVTTSSCAGRVAVFVEGEKGKLSARREETGQDEGENKAEGGGGGKGPSGKGGGHWAYVSHERMSLPSPGDGDGDGDGDGERRNGSGAVFAELLGLRRTTPSQEQNTHRKGYGNGHEQVTGNVKSPQDLRLARLSFSPLILHILCASLQHARPVLAAAMNAGFRESGVQSLRILEDAEAGVMVGVRTNGLAFETVVGYVEEENGQEVVRCCVSEEYLQMCVGIVNERFGWNDERRERFVRELERAVQGEKREWEDEETRRARKREEGLRKQMVVKRERDHEGDGEDGGLGDGLSLELG